LATRNAVIANQPNFHRSLERSKSLEKQLNAIARKPEEQAAFEEGYRQATDEFVKGLRLLPIETQDLIIEALKKSRVKYT